MTPAQPTMAASVPKKPVTATKPTHNVPGRVQLSLIYSGALDSKGLNYLSMQHGALFFTFPCAPIALSS